MQVTLDGINGISIHAPRTGSDDSQVLSEQGRCNFNPRSPHGERRVDDGRGDAQF